jgi:hypothetical protein
MLRVQIATGLLRSAREWNRREADKLQRLIEAAHS